MKRAKLIYNPYSGNKAFKSRLDIVVDKLQKCGYEVTLYRTMSIDGIYETMKRNVNYDCIITSGGDGTLNHVINAMAQNNINVPVGILPSGTANDFANHLNIPKDVARACDVIVRGNTTEFDLGKINDRYFINVAAAGLLTDVSQKIDINLKNTLGKMAYYIKGIEQLPNFRAIPITIKYENKIINEMVYLFVILNGSTAGGFRLAPESTADDGNLNLVAIKACSVVELFNIFIKMLKGYHLGDSNVIYLKGKEFLIESRENIEADVDGEAGPHFPLDIRISDRKVRVFTP